MSAIPMVETPTGISYEIDGGTAADRHEMHEALLLLCIQRSTTFTAAKKDLGPYGKHIRFKAEVVVPVHYLLSCK
jgi:hypothetical protein